MDIPVSRLNERMALRVPSELPLGLVFIVGQVEAIRPYGPDPEEIALQLADGEHSLPCRLPQQVAEEMQLVGKERVRAGGQLIFDTREARYYLLARDIEVLPTLALADEVEAPGPPVDAPPQQGSSGLAPGELPPWVRQLAPPELQSEMSLAAAPMEAEVEVEPEYEPSPLPPGLVEFLSQAIDSDQEIELTPTLFHELVERYEARPWENSIVPPAPDEGAPTVADTVHDDEIGEEPADVPEEASWPHDDAVPAPEVVMVADDAANVLEVEQNGQQKQPAPAQTRQMLILLVGVFALFFFILLVFVVIAFAAGYTPFLTP